MQILEKAIGKIPYSTVDIYITVDGKDLELHEKKKKPVGFQQPTATSKERVL
jgi:hypothetical protein